MDKKLFGLIGISGLACVACCALPLLSLAGIGASIVTIWNGPLPYILGVTSILAVVVVIKLRGRGASLCTTNSCGTSCVCKSKE